MIDLKTFRKINKLTQEQAANYFEVSQSFISQIEKGDRPVPDTFISKIKADANYTLPPDLVSSEEGASYINRRFLQKNINATNNHSAPLVPVKAQAGYSRCYDQSEYIDALEKYALPPNITRHGAIWRYWEIEGDSMLPTFKETDIILTSQVHDSDWDYIRNFYCYVIVTSEQVFFKRIAIDNGRWIAISDNEDNGYEQFIIQKNEVKELWVFRRHIQSTAPVPKEFKIKI